MKKAAAYIRVSTNDQLEYSPDAQLKAIEAFALKNEIEILPEHIYIDEGITGRSVAKRGAFNLMIKCAKEKPKPFDLILVHKFDRFARNREDSVVYKALLRKECNIKVISISEHIEEDKFAVILEAMLEAMAEFYSLNLSDEVKKGMVEKASRGGIQQQAPYGYENKENSFKVIPLEAQTVKQIFSKFVDENKGLKEIATELNELGIRTKRNNLFQSKTIKYILTNPTYTGYIRWNRKRKDGKIKEKKAWIIEQGHFEPIIKQDVYEQAQKKLDLMKKINQRNARPSNKYKHYLSGLLRCSECGGTMVFAKTNKDYAYYRCRKAYEGGCGQRKMIRVDRLEEAIIKQIEQDYNQVEMILSNKSPLDAKEEDRCFYHKQLKLIQKKFQQAKGAYLAGIDSLNEYKENKQEYELEKAEIIAQLKKLGIADKSINQQRLYLISDLIRKNPSSITMNNKILKTFVRHIEVDVKEACFAIEYYLPEG